MNTAWLLLLLPLAAASGWWIALRQSVGDEHEAQDLNQSYLQGLNQVLACEDDDALAEFLETIEKQPKSVELQIALGSICRRRGEYERASLIHQAILNNKAHPANTHAQAQFELAQDYQAAGWLDRSESLYVELLKNKRFQYDTAKNLLRIYQHEKDWENAIHTVKFLSILSASDSASEPTQNKLSEQLAHYYCEICEACMREGLFSKAEASLIDAEKTQTDHPRALILRGRLSAFNGEHLAAIKHWRKLELMAPTYLVEVLPNIKESYQQLNDLPAYLKFLKQAALVTHDSQVHAALFKALTAENTQSASQLMMQHLKAQPSIDGLKQLLQNWKTRPNNIKQDDLLFLLESMSALVQQESQYQCKECGFKANGFAWSCPGCFNWSSYIRLSPVGHDQASSFTPLQSPSKVRKTSNVSPEAQASFDT